MVKASISMSNGSTCLAIRRVEWPLNADLDVYRSNCLRKEVLESGSGRTEGAAFSNSTCSRVYRGIVGTGSEVIDMQCAKPDGRIE